jgi:hypothetical protein
LVLRYSAEKISPLLFDQLLKTFKTQLKIEPNLKRFIGKVVADGQELIVELERPKTLDETKIRQYLEAHLK